MKKLQGILSYFLLVLVVFSSMSFSQLKKLEGNDLYTESDIYVSPEGVRYSDLITLQFNKLMINNNLNPIDININNINQTEAKDFLLSVRKKYGDFKIVKSCPQKFWGDTVAINKRTKKKVIVPDFSQLVILKFKNLVPIDSIVSSLLKQNYIAFAEGPKLGYVCAHPNDPLYSSATHWAFDIIEAEKAWDVTKGSASILVGINDRFLSGNQLHEDIVDKVVYAGISYFGDHGGSIAGIAGATTDNNLGIASLGWNTKLVLTNWFASGILEAIDHGSDVINMSWITQQNDYPEVRNAIHTALLEGIVVVAAAGNQTPENVNYIPSVQYPAAYNFGSDGQVIATSATQWDGSNETFVDGWNFSPGTDPINNPTNSFIDISAPGKNIEILVDNNGYSPNGAGTSDAAPFVSALCGLILSINASLTPNQVYNIITNSADKIGQYGYDSNGWNRYMGYGRINAYNALKYTLENYGGTLTQSLTIPTSETWNFAPGITVKFAPGISLIVNGTLTAVGTPSAPITFTSQSGTTPGSWGGIIFDGTGTSSSILDNTEIKYASDVRFLNGANATIQNSLLEHCTQGVYIYNSTPKIINNQISEPSQNGIYCDASGKVPLIKDNDIIKTSSNSYYQEYQGVWVVNHTYPFIAHNYISGFYNGSYLGGGTISYFSDYGTLVNPNNYIENCMFGLITGWGSTTLAGIYNSFGYNSIFNNELYDVYSYQNSNVYAELNYWGGGLPNQYVDGTSTLDTDPYLTQNPWGGSLASISQEDQDKLVANISSLSSLAKQSGISLKIYDIINLDNTGQMEEAIDYYKKMIEEDNNTNFALTSLACIKDYYKRQDLMLYFQNLLKTNFKHKNDLYSLLASQYIQVDEYDNAINLYDEIVKNQPETYDGINARLNKYFAAINYKKDYNVAAKILSEIEAINIEDRELDLRKEFAKYLLDISAETYVQKSSKDKSTVSENNEVPKEFLLDQNYPNPFNPTTTIKYQLPQDGLVILKIYDVLGNEIATLVNEQKVAGIYEVNFDASSLSSGVYIYKIQAGHFINSKKMILIK